MDAHFPTPFTPKSIVVFYAGPADDAERQTPYARALPPGCRARCGRTRLPDVQTTGTLADLARARADLAIGALPPDEVAATLWRWRRALAAGRCSSSAAGWTLNAALSCSALRGARTCTCSGPTASASSAPRSASMPAPQARCHWRFAGPGVAVRRAHRLDAGLGANNHVGFSQVVSIGPDAAVTWPRCWTSSPPMRTHGIVVYPKVSPTPAVS